jgi:hypothetical protein
MSSFFQKIADFFKNLFHKNTASQSTATPAQATPVAKAAVQAPVAPSTGVLSGSVPSSPVSRMSNGAKCNPPQPTVSPGGNPLWYAIGVGNMAIGPGRPMASDGTTFDTDAQVATYEAAKAANSAPRKAPTPTDPSGPVPYTSLTKDDWKFLTWATHMPGFINWEFDVLSGPASAIKSAIDPYMQNIAWMRTYDPNAYTGVLKQYYKGPLPPKTNTPVGA